MSAWSIASLLRVVKGMRRHFRKLEIGSGVLLIAVGVAIATDQVLVLNAGANARLSGLAEPILWAEGALLP